MGAKLYDRREVTGIDSASMPLQRFVPTVFRCNSPTQHAYSRRNRLKTG